MRTLRTLLIAPPYGIPRMEPNGLLYLATFARARGFPVDLIYESHKTRITVEEASRRAVEGGYDVVGVTAMTPTLPRALAVLGQVKRLRPAVRTVMGGYHATVAHESVLRKCPEVEVAVRGDGEHTLVEMLDRWERGVELRGVLGLTYREGDRVVANDLRPQPRDLDALPFPDRSLGPGPEEYVHWHDEETGRPVSRANVTSSRGCPYGCAFCVLGSDDPGSPISLRRWRFRSPENVVAEIDKLLVDRGVGSVAFAEDNFTVSPRRLERFADLVLARGLRFTFSCDSRANQICRLEKVMGKLRRAGLRKVEVGIESGSPAVLARFAKGTRVEDNVRALAILREHGIEPHIDFIMFDLYTTIEDLEQNLAFLGANAPPLYDHGRTVYHRLELHPGTELQRRYLAEGIVRGEPDQIVPYDFDRPEVARVYRVMDRFYWDHQLRLEELKKRVHFLQVHLVAQGRRDAARRLARDLVFVVIPANGLPLKLLGAVLAAGRASGHDRGALERAARPFEDRTSALEKELEEILDRHDLRRAAWEACESPLAEGSGA